MCSNVVVHGRQSNKTVSIALHYLLISAYGGDGYGDPVPCGGGGCGSRCAVRSQRRRARGSEGRSRRADGAAAAPARQERRPATARAATASQLLTSTAATDSHSELYRKSKQQLSKLYLFW